MTGINLMLPSDKEVRMKSDKREEIRRSLRKLAEMYAIDLMEKTIALLYEECSADALIFNRSVSPASQEAERLGLVVDGRRFTVTFGGRTCLLRNTLPFKVLERLAERPNVYVSHEILLQDVWRGPRTDDAVRSVIKTLRSKLRQAGLVELATAIDGTSRGHFALRLRAN
jgi:DNA-binding response OmpR family regulator